MTRAVVFAYHNVGVRCLKVLLAHGVDVALVVTHKDNPSEQIWFDSVAAIAADYGIPVIAPEDPPLNVQFPMKSFGVRAAPFWRRFGLSGQRELPVFHGLFESKAGEPVP